MAILTYKVAPNGRRFSIESTAILAITEGPDSPDGDCTMIEYGGTYTTVKGAYETVLKDWMEARSDSRY